MAILQPIIDLVEILAQKGVEKAFICPGSRNAPLTVAFSRHPKITCLSVSDERSAGFIALGLAQMTSKPVVILCTSGSAAYNFAPAVAEAFFQEIPLIILTADRPQEWIHQYDGQTIFQENIYGKHVKKSYQLSSDYSHKDSKWFIQRIVNEAVNKAMDLPLGPIHINIPLREPFYPNENEEVIQSNDIKIVERLPIQKTIKTEDWNILFARIKEAESIVIAIGQSRLDKELIQILKELNNEYNFVVVGDVISNLGDEFVSKQDLFLKNADEKFSPELLITAGKSFISKDLKQYFKKFPPTEHWHIQEIDDVIDPFQSLTMNIPIDKKDFFKKVLEDVDYEDFRTNEDGLSINERFKNHWGNANLKAQKYQSQFFRNTNIVFFTEFEAMNILLESIPENSIIHVANSMPVRYLNYLGIATNRNIEVFANRGTSGIDGCTSTAMGCALGTNKTVYLLTGDVAFFYDRNAFWNSYLPNNLRVVLFNNHGGGIFRMIDGSSKLPELETFFETTQKSNAKNLAQEFNILYNLVGIKSDFEQKLGNFIGQNQCQILEIETEAKVNTEYFKKFKNMEIEN
jgi:2-succinyl-5-enolpyruvyl-6-hydroxy-3-cyclohexene-1-carboxylate synthase